MQKRSCKGGVEGERERAGDLRRLRVQVGCVAATFYRRPVWAQVLSLDAVWLLEGTKSYQGDVRGKKRLTRPGFEPGTFCV